MLSALLSLWCKVEGLNLTQTNMVWEMVKDYPMTSNPVLFRIMVDGAISVVREESSNA